MISKDDHIRRLGEIELERAALLEEMDHIQDRLAALDTEYGALKSLLTSPTPDRRWASHGTSFVEAVYHLLKDAGEPLHYKEIYRQLRDQLFYIGGSAALSNLVVQLSRDRRFMRVGRGVYGLAEWGTRTAGRNSSATTMIALRTNSNRKRCEAVAVARGRERERLRFILESLEIDIQVTQSNLQALRNRLLGRPSAPSLPEGIDPKIALPALETRLSKLLNQRDQLEQHLPILEDQVQEAEVSSVSD